jgi:hypothetical protein
MMDIAEGLGEGSTYARAFEGIRSLPESGKETLNITQALSNPYVLSEILKGTGGKIYDAKNDPLGVGIGFAKVVTNYEMYMAGANQENLYYGAALIIGGLATEIGSPLKALKALDIGADVVKAGVKAADNVLVYGSEKGLTTILDSAKFSFTGTRNTGK